MTKEICKYLDKKQNEKIDEYIDGNNKSLVGLLGFITLESIIDFSTLVGIECLILCVVTKVKEKL